MLVPVGIALAYVAQPAALPFILAIDTILVLIALFDLLANRGSFDAVRALGHIQSLGHGFTVGLRVTNTSGRRLSLRVMDDVAGDREHLPVLFDLAPAEVGEGAYGVTLKERGHYHFGPITARWLSPVGLWERQQSLSVPGEFRVYPDFSPLRDYGLRAAAADQRVPVRARRQSGGESEFQRLRLYVPGDPYRHIDWKASARRQQFVTREYGQESNQNVIFLLDAGRLMSARLGELTAWDHALNAALAMGHAALRHGDRVGLLAFDRTVRAWVPPKGGTRNAQRLIRATYDVFPSTEESDFAAAFRHLSRTVQRRSLVVLLTSVQDEVNAEQASAVLRAMSSRHLPVCVWLRDAGLGRLLDQPAENEADLYHRCAAAEIAGWREAALAGLRRQGALVVDCAPDRLSTELLGRYLEIKARRLL